MTLFQKQDGSMFISDQFLTKREVMEMLCISQSTIQRMMKAGMPHTSYKNFTAFEMDKVSAWLKENGYGTPELVQMYYKKNNEVKRGMRQ